MFIQKKSPWLLSIIMLVFSVPTSAVDGSERGVTQRDLARFTNNAGLIMAQDTSQLSLSLHSGLSQTSCCSSGDTGSGALLRRGVTKDTEIQLGLATTYRETYANGSKVSDGRGYSLFFGSRFRLIPEGAIPGSVLRVHVSRHHVSGARTETDWGGGAEIEIYKSSDPALLYGKFGLDKAPFDTGLSATGEAGMVLLLNNRLALELAMGSELASGNGIHTGKAGVTYRTAKHTYVSVSWNSARWGNESSSAIGMDISFNL